MSVNLSNIYIEDDDGLIITDLSPRGELRWEICQELMKERGWSLQEAKNWMKFLYILQKADEGKQV